MTPPVLYRAWDLRIRSCLSIPGGMPLPPDGDAVDIDVAWGSASLAGPVRRDGPYRVGRDAFEFSMPGVARYRCDRAAVLVDPVDGASLDDVAAMLVATALPALLWMRGDVVLHAAAIVPPGGTDAVAVLGRSGSGKSTFLAHALAEGAAIVADDSIRVAALPEGVRISGLPGGYFAPHGSDEERRPFHPVDPDRRRARAALGELIVLDAPDRRLKGAAAMQALLTHRHRPRVARLMGLEAAALATIARIARDVPIYGCDRLRRDVMTSIRGRIDAGHQ